MCTRAEAQPWVDVRPAVNLVRIARVVTERTIVGTIGAVSFAIVHAMLIVPIGTLVVAAASGGFAGWILTQERRASPAFAIAAFVLTAAAGGPVPAVNSARAAWLFIGFLPICVAAGTAITLARRVVRKDMS
jgi:hypothetical protein